MFLITSTELKKVIDPHSFPQFIEILAFHQLNSGGSFIRIKHEYLPQHVHQVSVITLEALHI